MPQASPRHCGTQGNAKLAAKLASAQAWRTRALGRRSASSPANGASSVLPRPLAATSKAAAAPENPIPRPYNGKVLARPDSKKPPTKPVSITTGAARKAPQVPRQPLRAAALGAAAAGAGRTGSNSSKPSATSATATQPMPAVPQPAASKTESRAGPAMKVTPIIIENKPITRPRRCAGASSTTVASAKIQRSAEAMPATKYSSDHSTRLLDVTMPSIATRGTAPLASKAWRGPSRCTQDEANGVAASKPAHCKAPKAPTAAVSRPRALSVNNSSGPNKNRPVNSVKVAANSATKLRRAGSGCKGRAASARGITVDLVRVVLAKLKTHPALTQVGDDFERLGQHGPGRSGDQHGAPHQRVSSSLVPKILSPASPRPGMM